MTQPTGRSRRQWIAYVEANGHKSSKEVLIKQMSADGISEQEALNILTNSKKRHIRTSFFMIFGGAVLIILGIFTTIWSYNQAQIEAQQSGSSYYYLYLGLVLGGAYFLITGLYRLITRKK